MPTKPSPLSRPTFIGIGVQKSATTWLYDLLRSHPQVMMSEAKEVDYFSDHYSHGEDWYFNQFPQPNQDTIQVGEISPSYFHHPDAPFRVHNLIPSAKLILCLRNPVDRLISNHQHEIRIGNVKGPDYSLESGIKSNPDYIEQCLYATHLNHWLEYFLPEQLLIILFDDVQSHPRKVEKDIYQFLGLNPEHSYDHIGNKSNPSYIYRNKNIELARKCFLTAVQRMRLEWLWDFARTAGLQKLYRKYNRAPVSNLMPTVNQSQRQLLINQFKEEINKLEIMIDRNLQDWLK